MAFFWSILTQIFQYSIYISPIEKSTWTLNVSFFRFVYLECRHLLNGSVKAMIGEKMANFVYKHWFPSTNPLRSLCSLHIALKIEKSKKMMLDNRLKPMTKNKKKIPCMVALFSFRRTSYFDILLVTCT